MCHVVEYKLQFSKNEIRRLIKFSPPFGCVL
uniref:Uncharacterized protein n=1 Tax=Rhizophora mucronata TaxID=61149 RepID=A0A2P2QV38_RHIMU